MEKDKSTILFVEQALSFGGSIVVLGSLVEGLDKERFCPIIVGEMDESILNYHVQEKAKIYVVPRLLNYVHWFKINAVDERIKPLLLFKLIIYLMSAISSLANTVYITRLVKNNFKRKGGSRAPE